jgi:hypothetical protein
VLLLDLERAGLVAVEVDAGGEGAQQAGVLRGVEVVRVRVGDEAARGRWRGLAVRGDAVDEVEVGGVGRRGRRRRGSWRRRAARLLVDERLELAPRAQPQRERVDVAGSGEARGELGVGGGDVREVGQVDAGLT